MARNQTNPPKTIRLPSPSKTYFSGRTLLLWTLCIAVLAGVFLFALSRPVQSWHTSATRVTEIRITLVGAREGGEARPGQALYRGEAHVRYQASGRSLDQWLPATEVSPGKEWLLFTLSQQRGKVAEVHWKPGSPEKAYLTFGAADQ